MCIWLYEVKFYKLLTHAGIISTMPSYSVKLTDPINIQKTIKRTLADKYPVLNRMHFSTSHCLTNLCTMTLFIYFYQLSNLSVKFNLSMKFNLTSYALRERMFGIVVC